MFCPNCGQERISHETSFCSRCGFLLTGTSELLQTGGVIPQITAPTASVMSPRKRGLKQGLFIFLLTFLIVPILAIISAALNIEPWAVAIASVLLFVGGLLRMAYALMFESITPGVTTLEENMLATARGLVKGNPGAHALPPQTIYPAREYAAPSTGAWRDTNDLQPKNVTESTTKLLESDEHF